MIQDSSDGIRLAVLVVPKASSTRVLGEHDGRLRVAVAAPPVDGAANAALRKAIARWLGMRRADVTIVAGESGRRKSINLAGQSHGEVEAWIRQQRETR